MFTLTYNMDILSDKFKIKQVFEKFDLFKTIHYQLK